ncbi:hypothetical protein BKA82DRAFT_239677 [Pisolithus tinctorius]|uniref:Uncharacterized protein n=1 Tax=Pisolithus tinctorius Marx 270 TaxID=870435 RepID=A0A0C3NMM1_PISTI|nr:hypothetical protein BKA82DRAFT_239677 [Pisolithus tinctorius]KIN96598.1 hypothetical protein M404DRAFT_239677 [Pisolithus tinctorius Marx 270]
MMLEEHGHFYQCLNEIGKIIKRTPHVHDDLAHLQRIMLDAAAGVSKHQLWLAGRVTEQNKWSSICTARDNHPAAPVHPTEHVLTSLAHQTLDAI